MLCAKIGFSYAHDDDGVAVEAFEVVVPDVAEEIFGHVLDASGVWVAGLWDGGDVGAAIVRVGDVGGYVDIYDAVAF